MVPVRNLLLETYRNATGHDLSIRSEAVALPARTVLYEPGSRPRYVHMLTSGLASIVSTMEDDEGVEVSMTGSEGFPENAYLLGTQVAPKRCIMQVAGTGVRFWFSAFEEEFLRNPMLHKLVLQELQYENFMMSQLVACNGLHQIEERLARWLLMVQDRTGSEDLPLTQEFLAQMLGARRSTVTLAAGNLQRSGMIDYRRGHIRIKDRERLEDGTCECYAIIRSFYANIYR